MRTRRPFPALHRDVRAFTLTVAAIPRPEALRQAEDFAARIDRTDVADADPQDVTRLWVSLARAVTPRALFPAPEDPGQARSAALGVIADAQAGHGVGKPKIGPTVDVALPSALSDGIEHWKVRWQLKSAAEAHRRVLAAGLAALDQAESA